MLELFSALGVAMVAVYIGFHLLDTLSFGAWGGKLPLSAALFILLLAPSFFEPLRELSAVWHDRAAGEAAVKMLDDLRAQGLRMPGALAARPHSVHEAKGAVSVELDGVSVRVPGTISAIPPLSLTVRAGEHVALWAPSGTGKSVLLAQLAGLIPVEQGCIRIAGQPLNDASAASLRQHMAWMGQRAHVFAASVQRNVSLGRGDVSADDVERATRTAALGEALLDRSAMTLGEGGVGLSGGEAVRLALARLAVHRHAGLLLVDEPTAHLDAETAAQVIDALLHIAEGCTLIVATHDAQLARRMDRVVPLLPQANAARSQAEVQESTT
ncbi:ATP-binding/permease protein CydD [bioreactor metagenome]|uniref:ATP-binding/permease protein CydD n=1 Tax=bioreactor metagenome TaxID=1076179 RepID=A0A645E668_9ZZZZ